MPRYLIEWNTPDGGGIDIVECENVREAEWIALDRWREQAEANAEYSAISWDDEDEMLNRIKGRR